MHGALRNRGRDVGGDYRKATGPAIRCLGGNWRVLWKRRSGAAVWVYDCTAGGRGTLGVGRLIGGRTLKPVGAELARDGGVSACIFC
ncbi:hypothetical protein BN844_0577 [Pseudomonas sp. SHC52]|nr:hypothetical protein BN844_0577 [Pseudomonas sp. SHC52]